MHAELLAMTNAPRFILAALAASVCLNLLACNTDDSIFDKDATFEPMSGTWTYEEEAVISNSCSDAIGMPAQLSTFTLDYDGGDEFQIELGDKDVMCEIDGTEFTCADYNLDPATVPGFDATIHAAVGYDGEFSSEMVADGSQVLAVTCVGEDCSLIDMVPCSRESTWSAEFVN
jgi:hypothetical protein